MQTQTLTPAALAEAIRAVDVAALAADMGVPLPGGYRLAVELEEDGDANIDDRVAWSSDRQQRPEGFDGSAEVVMRERGYRLWWQPRREGKKVHNSAEDRTHIIRCLEQGFVGVMLSLWEPIKSVVGSREELPIVALWGVEAWDWERVLPDLVAELAAEVEAAAAP